jgi:hypothetical protein
MLCMYMHANFATPANENGEAGIEREQVEHVFFERTLGGG